MVGKKFKIFLFISISDFMLYHFFQSVLQTCILLATFFFDLAHYMARLYARHQVKRDDIRRQNKAKESAAALQDALGKISSTHF